jgi:hypothetical protein
MQEAKDSSQGGYIHRPGVHLPPFWPDRPGLCFATAEVQFDFASVTSEKTKFNYMISQLEYRHAAEVVTSSYYLRRTSPIPPSKPSLCAACQHLRTNASASS